MPPEKIQPDLRQIGITICVRLQADLNQTDHRHQHPQIPKPADKQVATTPN